MNELAIADIDADVRQAPCVGVLEEDQIARLEIATTDRCALVDLGRGARADIDTQRVEDHPVREAGAIEAGGTVRRPDVWVTEILHRVIDDCVASVRTTAAAV